MIALKSIAAIYVSLYLVLPACICQLLSAFGCDIHGNAMATGPEPVAQVTAAVSYVAPICHCDDHVSKTAEPDMCGSIGIDHFDLMLSAVNVPSLKVGSRECSAGLYSRGPPPGSPVWSLAPYSGVYRI